MPTTKSTPRKNSRTQQSKRIRGAQAQKSAKGAKAAKPGRTASTRGSTKSRRAAAASGGATRQRSYIVETSPLTWSTTTVGPTFNEIQLAAYHRWLQAGGNEFDNWLSAERDLRGGSGGGAGGK